MKENTEYLELFIIVDESKFHAKSRKLIAYHRNVLFGKNDMFCYCFIIGKYSNILISDKTENGSRKLNGPLYNIYLACKYTMLCDV